MSLLDQYKEELNNPSVNYFIFDTKSKSKDGDIDYKQYRWHISIYNRVKEGDLFIYRRPQGASGNRQFYFFGACKIDKINGEDEVIATLIKKHPFEENIFQNELEKFHWTFKERNKTWEHFFNQYGMNKINKEDFVNILKLADKNTSSDYFISDEEEIKATQQIESKNFFIEDTTSEVKIRSYQNAFSKKIKLNYGFKCAICDLKTKDFLRGSHIIPWAVDKNNRLNPANGICLCALHHIAFDCGYIAVDNNYKIIVSPSITEKKDLILYNELIKHQGSEIQLPSDNFPDPTFLAYHRSKIFKQR